MVPMVLALYGHPDSGGIWEQHLNANLAKKGWRQILPEMWQSIFRHDELDLILVVYVDDFKMAGPKKNLAKGWAGIRSVVDLGEPEPCDRYFGRMHVEKNGVKLPIGAHPFAHVFDPQRASACSAQIHRKNDYWEHDPNHQIGRAITYSQGRNSSSRGTKGASSTVRSSLEGRQCSMQQ